MQTNAQIRIYSAGIYLLKVSNVNSRTGEKSIINKIIRNKTDLQDSVTFSKSILLEVSPAYGCFFMYIYITV